MKELILQVETSPVSDEKKAEVKWYIENPIAKYVKLDKLTEDEASHLVDYLLSDRAPTRLRRLSIKDCKRKTEEWVSSLVKKGQNIIETEEDTEVIKRFNSTGLSLVKLKGSAAFKREGAMMRHCVGSYVDRTDCEIYSIRDDKGLPHCTIEVKKDNGYISQVKGKGNGPIHPKYIHAVIKSLKKIGKDINGSELSNLGYAELSDNMWSFINSKFEPDSIKYIVFNNQKYLYKNSNLKERSSKTA